VSLARVVELSDAVVLQLSGSCDAVCCSRVAFVLQGVAVSSEDKSRRESLWREALSSCVVYV